MKRAVPAAAILIAAAAVLLVMHSSKRARVDSDSANTSVASNEISDSIVTGRAAPVAGHVAQYSAQDLAKGRVLDEIFHSRNDNDMRLDTDFRDLSDSAKELLREKYRGLAAERRNEKGTIVFLLGRNLTSAKDFAFLKDVLSEGPCLSLADCARESVPTEGPALHEEIGTDITLAYPQIIALEMLHRFLSTPGVTGSGLNQTAQRVLESATRSTIPIVANRAQRLMDRAGQG